MKASDARDYAFAGSKYQPRPKPLEKTKGDGLPSGFCRQSNTSPWSTEVHAMDRGALNEHVCGIFPMYEYDWHIDSWDKTMKIVDRLGMLTYPRYIQLNKSGVWSVRDHGNKAPISTGDTGPIAVCRALVILYYGKGRPHSTVQKD